MIVNCATFIYRTGLLSAVCHISKKTPERPKVAIGKTLTILAANPDKQVVFGYGTKSILRQEVAWPQHRAMIYARSPICMPYDIHAIAERRNGETKRQDQNNPEDRSPTQQTTERREKLLIRLALTFHNTQTKSKNRGVNKTTTELSPILLSCLQSPHRFTLFPACPALPRMPPAFPPAKNYLANKGKN